MEFFLLMRRRPPRSTWTGTLFPAPTRFRSWPRGWVRKRRSSPWRRMSSGLARGSRRGRRVSSLISQPLQHACEHEARSRARRGARQLNDLVAERLITAADHLAEVAGGFEAHRAFVVRSEEHKSELQSLMRISYAVFCLKKKNIY